MTADAARSNLRFETDGARHASGALSDRALADLHDYANSFPAQGAGVRVHGDVRLRGILGADGEIGRLAAAILGGEAMAVRAILFDKTAELNWLVPWHQDRTIAVRAARGCGLRSVVDKGRCRSRRATLRDHG
jgi:hypothetical protein